MLISLLALSTPADACGPYGSPPIQLTSDTHTATVRSGSLTLTDAEGASVQLSHDLYIVGDAIFVDDGLIIIGNGGEDNVLLYSLAGELAASWSVGAWVTDIEPTPSGAAVTTYSEEGVKYTSILPRLRS